MQESMSLKYEPSSEPVHISVKWLFLNWKLYLSVQLLVVALIEVQRVVPSVLNPQGFSGSCPQQPMHLASGEA